MHIGIDLGTTFCCVAFIDNDGSAKVIPNSDGELTTPSVIWFNGTTAMVGNKANNMKNVPGMEHFLFEFVKRDMGKPLDAADFAEDDSILEAKPYEILGFKYGAAGMSAIILRKLKLEAIRYLKKRGLLDATLDEKSYLLDAVITVPAYFGDRERQATKLAGQAAGLNVIRLINEPTAAAITYGFTHCEKKCILVFDLGGGTFDVTLLEMNDGDAKVIATDGANTLGGKNWDELIQDYLYREFHRLKKCEIPYDKGFYIQRKALEAKFSLSAHESVDVSIIIPDGDLDTTLYRSRLSGNEFEMTNDSCFYFEDASTDLMSICRNVCTRLLERANLKWDDIDEIIMAGGACRMPMIPKLLEELSGKKIQREVKGFNFDTAIAIGAALYGQFHSKVTDVISHSIGIKILENDQYFVDRFLEKNTSLPASNEKIYPADAHAVLSVWEGESKRPDECTQRGRLQLNNPEGIVKIKMVADTNGMIKFLAEHQNGTEELVIVEGKNPIEKLLQLKPKIELIEFTF